MAWLTPSRHRYTSVSEVGIGNANSDAQTLGMFDKKTIGLFESHTALGCLLVIVLLVLLVLDA